jgi:ABC-type lipoprotein release transport system permease subunit
MQTLVFGVSATDPATYVAIAAATLLTVLAASLLPALRASRVDPVVALKGN